MYTIGQFSKIGRISTKTLRFYDEIGLLKPVFVDQVNQYRYYSGEQVADILLLNELRDYGFSLEEIKEILMTKNLGNLKQALTRKMIQLAEESERLHKLEKKLQNKIELINKGGSFMPVLNNFKIEVKEKQPVFVFGIRKTIRLEKISELIEELCGVLGDKGCKVTGPMMTFYYDPEFNPENIDIEVCMPVIKEPATQIPGGRLVPGGTYASTLYTGPYSGIGAGYAAIMTWIQDNGYNISGPGGETYLVPPDQTSDENKYVTEISFPVHKN